ncbi:hypothetical protein PROFUN_15153 [Planoprotostelium fungivorum]|uniref:Uncharacterized protein n=1 Tax=Planoprotostelium fungivorum TaxID=1890364 RepID=A0A2P6MXS1_9EUKA|nr:hypothetical protein PROFUN_15153 [Planoprotostelium fungivorum]
MRFASPTWLSAFAVFACTCAQSCTNHLSKGTTLDASSSPTLCSPNGLWKLEITQDGWLQVVNIMDGKWRWRPVYANGSSTSKYMLNVQNGNVQNTLWKVEGCQSSTPTTPYNLTLTDQGTLIQSNQTLTFWSSSIITNIDTRDLTTDGGIVTLNGVFPTLSLNFSLDSLGSGRSSFSDDRKSVMIDVPPGSGTNLTLALFPTNPHPQTQDEACQQSRLNYYPFHYPANFSILQDPSFTSIRVEVINVLFNSTVTLEGRSCALPLSNQTVNLNGEVFFPVPTNIISCEFNITLYNATGDPKISRTFQYTNPVGMLGVLNVSGTSVAQIFGAIESIAVNALKTADTFQVSNRDGISLYAAVVDQRGNGTTGRLNGTETSFSVPLSVIQSVSGGGEKNTRVTVILSSIEQNVFGHTDNWTIVSGLVGLSLYINNTYVSVDDQNNCDRDERADAVCLYWAEESRGWKRDGCDTERGQGSITCLCSHLTNFTVGIPSQDRSSQQGLGNKLYLLAILGLVPIIIERHRMTKRQDIEIEKEIGRGRESVVYAALKGGTTRVAVKKSRREDKMRGEAQRLREVHHPDILMCLGVYREEKMICLVIRDKKLLDDDQIQNIMREIAAGLSYLHENTVVHGRLCPQKVYMTSSHHAKLSAYVSDTMDDIPAYMERYMAPEVKTSRKSTTEGDVFSFGVLFEEVKNRGRVQRENREMVQLWSDIIGVCMVEKVEERIDMKRLGVMLNPAQGHHIAAKFDTSIVHTSLNKATEGLGYVYIRETKPLDCVKKVDTKCMSGILSDRSNSSDYILSHTNDGNLVHQNSSTISWTSFVINLPDYSISIDEGLLNLTVRTFHSCSKLGLLHKFTLNDQNLSIPSGVGLNLSLKASASCDEANVLFSYATPTATFRVTPFIIYINGKSLVQLLFSLKYIVIHSSHSIASYIPTSSITFTLIWSEVDVFTLATVIYVSPMDALRGVISTTPTAQIFGTIESIVVNALKTQPTRSKCLTETVSLSMLLLSIRLNGTETSFSVPLSVIQSVSGGGEKNTRVTVILSSIEQNVFGHTDNWTIVSGLVGLSLYINNTYASVTDTNDRITNTIPLPVNITNGEGGTKKEEQTEMLCVYWAEESRGWKRDGCDTERGQGSITCLCSHLTNFTIGIPSQEITMESREWNKMYLFAVNVTDDESVILIIALSISKRKQKSYLGVELELKDNDIEIEKEIGRGRESDKSGSQEEQKRRQDERGSTETQKQLTEDRMREIAVGLSYLHENTVVHGRLCPQKVYMTSSHHAKLSAYGSTRSETKQNADNRRRHVSLHVSCLCDLILYSFSFGVIFQRLGEKRKGREDEPRDWNDIILSCTRERAEERTKMKEVGRKLSPQMNAPAMRPVGLDNVYVE